LGYDERDATMLAVKLRDDARLGDSIVAVPQGKRLSEAFKLLEVLIRSRRLQHDGHPVLGWTFANAEPRRDRLGALWIEKPSETKRIDGAQATAIALSQLMLLPARRPRRGGALIWTPSGFVTYEDGKRVFV
jgi:phage terminase large subunit-like protein